MQTRKIQQALFTCLLSVSVFSSIYLNNEAQTLQAQGFDVHYLSMEDAEAMMPDVKIINHLLKNFTDVLLAN